MSDYILMKKIIYKPFAVLGYTWGKICHVCKRILSLTYFQLLRNELIKWKLIAESQGEVSFGEWVFFGKNVKLRAEKGGKIIIQKNVRFLHDCDIRVLDGGTLTIAEGCIVGIRCHIRCRKNIAIHRNVHIGPDCKIIDYNHAINLNRETLDTYWLKSIIIEEGVGIFSNVFIALGSHIGKFAKVTLNSYVSGPVPSSCVAGGNPLTIIHPRDKKPASASPGVATP